MRYSLVHVYLSIITSAHKSRPNDSIGVDAKVVNTAICCLEKGMALAAKELWFVCNVHITGVVSYGLSFSTQ